MKFAPIIGAVIVAVAAAMLTSIVEERAGWPWWVSEVGLIVGGVVGFVAGQKFAAGKQG